MEMGLALDARLGRGSARAMGGLWVIPKLLGSGRNWDSMSKSLRLEKSMEPHLENSIEPHQEESTGIRCEDLKGPDFSMVERMVLATRFSSMISLMISSTISWCSFGTSCSRVDRFSTFGGVLVIAAFWRT